MTKYKSKWSKTRATKSCLRYGEVMCNEAYVWVLCRMLGHLNATRMRGLTILTMVYKWDMLLKYLNNSSQLFSFKLRVFLFLIRLSSLLFWNSFVLLNHLDIIIVNSVNEIQYISIFTVIVHLSLVTLFYMLLLTFFWTSLLNVGNKIYWFGRSVRVYEIFLHIFRRNADSKLKVNINEQKKAPLEQNCCYALSTVPNPKALRAKFHSIRVCNITFNNKFILCL